MPKDEVESFLAKSVLNSSVCFNHFLLATGIPAVGGDVRNHNHATSLQNHEEREKLSVVQAANTNVIAGIPSVCIAQGKCRVAARFPLANGKDHRSASLRSYDI
jgi:hypothetical protein